MGKLTALMGFLLLAVSPAWAQTPAPSPAPGAPPAATGGGIADYWWIILLVIIVAAAIWYFSRSRRGV